ncbi:MAG: c-type heme family protein [Verrucomicrobiia bacterium]|jgi:hypothetical protein
MKSGRMALVFAVCVLLIAGILFSANQKPQPAPKKKLQLSIQPRHMADAIYAILSGHREVYTELYAEGGETTKFPNPCETFRKNSIAVAAKGVEFSYVLRGVHPITPLGTAETEFERKAIESVIKKPDEPFCGEELLGGRWYFTAVYADRAFHNLCVDCHNKKATELKTPYKLGDVLGVIVIRVALEL